MHPDEHDDQSRPIEGTAPGRGREVSPAGLVSTGRLLAWSLPLALVAGILSAMGTELAYTQAAQELREGPFNPSFEGNEPPNYEQMGGYEKRDAIVEFELRTKPPAEVKNAALAYGLLGALLGASLGLAGGLARRSTSGGASAALVGMIAGALGGVVGSLVMGPIYFRLLRPESGLELTLMTHGVIWALVGMAGGLALGLGLGRRHLIPTALVGGLIGGVLGTFAFEVINALMFPQVRVFEPVPTERGPRVAAALCVAVCVAIGAVLSLQDRRPKPKKSTPVPID